MSSSDSPQQQDPTEANARWFAALPAIFVFFWATGFIGAKYGLPHAGPMTFLTLRFAIVAVLLILVSLAFSAPWPKRSELPVIIVGGLFVHAAYLSCVFLSIDNGVETGVSAMMAGLQPVITALLAGPMLGEQVTKRQWAGLLLGLAGVALVVETKLAQGLGTPIGMVLAFMAAVSLTIGTLWQKRFGGQMDLRSGSAVQFTAAALVCAPVAIWFENFRHEWTFHFALAMGWLVVVLSVGTITVLFTLIRRGAASKVASLFYLVPPMTALLGYFIFGEKLGVTAFIGMLLIVIAVAMVTITPRQQ
jgi:drug/metabolite transporter (DMT)-like permease